MGHAHGPYRCSSSLRRGGDLRHRHARLGGVNVATGYRGKVHLSSTDAKAGTSDYTFTSSDNGVHVFSFTFNTLGNQTLTIGDTSNSSLSCTTQVNVVPK